MALTAADKKALEVIADEVDKVASWHDGPRAAKVLKISENLRNFTDVAQELVDDAEAKEAAAKAEQEAAEQAAKEAAAAEKKANKPQ